MKMEIQQQLLGDMMMARCEANPEIVFYRNRCSGNRIIRFTTLTLEDLVPVSKSRTGAWKTGVLLQYEIKNEGTALRFQLSLSASGLNQTQKKTMDGLLQAAGTEAVPDEKGILSVRQWEYAIGMDTEKAHNALDEIFDVELPFFELEVQKWMEDHSHPIRPFPELEEDSEPLEDGKEIHVRANRFERNRLARRKCIAHYGTACQICGFDFGSLYGGVFSGKIEVHHIVPLSEIREEYVVDPIRDLVPVCSNCHTALHSKKDGCYTPDELREILPQQMKQGIHQLVRQLQLDRNNQESNGT